MFLGKKFYAGCPSCRNPPNLFGLGTGIRKDWNVAPMLIERITIERNKSNINYYNLNKHYRAIMQECCIIISEKQQNPKKKLRPKISLVTKKPTKKNPVAGQNDHFRCI